MDTTPKNTSFDPYDQVLTLVYPDGVTGAQVSISTIFALQRVVLQMAAVYGVHVGITTILILLLGLLTKADKRRSVVFALNMAALVAFWIRAILMLVAAGSPIMNYYNWCLGLYDDLGNSMDVSIAAEILGFLALAAVELSLLFQVRIVCCTLQRRHRFLIAFGSIVIVLVTVSMRFALAVTNIMWSMVMIGETSEAQLQMLNNIQFGSTVCNLCSILIFSVAFCTKLGYAIYQRRKMGMTQFGPMQIIFVMGCQTLLIPGLFGVISFFYIRGSQIYSIMPLLVAVFLPLSAIWASTNTSKNINIAAPYQWRKQNLRKSVTANSSNKYTNEKGHLTSNSTTDGTLVDQRNESFSGASPSSKKAGMGHQATTSRDSIDLELQKGDHRIHIDRTYSVRSG